MSRKAVIIIFLTIDQCTGQAGAVVGVRAAAKTRPGVSCLGARGNLPSPRPPSPALARPLTLRADVASKMIQ